jgi:hypothetical protein
VRVLSPGPHVVVLRRSVPGLATIQLLLLLHAGTRTQGSDAILDRLGYTSLTPRLNGPLIQARHALGMPHRLFEAARRVADWRRRCMPTMSS